MATATAIAAETRAGIDRDHAFLFDAHGYLHLRGVLPQGEIDAYLAWAAAVRAAAAPPPGEPDAPRLLNRPIDADPRFLRILDHPVAEPYLTAFLGGGYRHIDNDIIYTLPGYGGGGWHRGVRCDPSGYARDGAFVCAMVKVFFCLTDVEPDGGAFVVIPGSHKSNFEIDLGRVDLPGQRVIDDVRAGDLIIFNEALLHNGRPHRRERPRITLLGNFGRRDSGVWHGYAPRPATLAAATPRQREILSNAEREWNEPAMWRLGFDEADPTAQARSASL
jgi:hypothetical protein